MGDCISRQAVLTYIEFILTHGMGKKKSFEFIKKFVGKLPSVTPKQKMGRWINDRCSKCGKGIEDLIASPEWYRDEQPNFCPFCGLKIVDSQESEGMNDT